MRDFTLEFTNLPYDYQYGGKELILQANLWNFIEKHVEDAIMMTAGEDKAQREQFEQERPWEVIDVNFVTTDWTEIDMLIKMDDIDRTKKKKIYAVQKLQETPEQAEDNAEDIEQANEAILEVLEQYNEIKKQFISLQEEKLYEEWTMTEENGRTEST